MSDKPKRMIFDISDDERDALERVRVKFGLRSHAETLRRLIRDADDSAPPPLKVGDRFTVQGHPVTVVAELPPATGLVSKPKRNASIAKQKHTPKPVPKQPEPAAAVASPKATPRRDTYPDWMRNKK